MKKRQYNQKGSITIEAAVFLPFFIIAVMTFVFLIKAYLAHEIIQHAITGACDEMSVYSLLYYETNAEELMSSLEKFCDSEKMETALGSSGLMPYIKDIGNDMTDFVRAQIVLVPVTKLLVKGNLGSSSADYADRRLKNLNIKEGFEGIDFSKSRMLSDERSIDIVASYNLEFPFLSYLLPGIKVVQTASACVWAGEEGIDKTDGDEDESGEDSVWDMENIKRGREIRRLQGANLPFNFPVIAKYHNGTATSIKSLNTDEEYYHNSDNLKKKLQFYINKLGEFNGGKSSSTTIDSTMILKKELVLVIPETDVLPHQQQTIDDCVQMARSKGIDMKVIKAYGKADAEKGDANIDKSYK